MRNIGQNRLTFLTRLSACDSKQMQHSSMASCAGESGAGAGCCCCCWRSRLDDASKLSISWYLRISTSRSSSRMSFPSSINAVVANCDGKKCTAMSAWIRMSCSSTPRIVAGRFLLKFSTHDMASTRRDSVAGSCFSGLDAGQPQEKSIHSSSSWTSPTKPSSPS